MKLEIQPESIAHHLERCRIARHGVVGIDGGKRTYDGVVAFELQVLAERSQPSEFAWIDGPKEQSHSHLQSR
jgi:hypothetical protein